MLEDYPEPDSSKDHIAHIPANIRTREDLFEALARELQFPDYFAHNWDALAECLRDFEWISKKRIFLLHNKVPALGQETLKVYLEVLDCSVKFWKEDTKHQLFVDFRLHFPSREEVATVFRQLISGEKSREEASKWSETWVLDDECRVRVHDWAVWEALTSLLGADSTCIDRPYLFDEEDFKIWLKDLEEGSAAR